MPLAGNKKILIVEDEAFLRKIFTQVFRQAGFDVLEAADGEAGLVMALAQHPDVTLLDILLPKMDGITVLKRIRQDQLWGKESLVIMLTNLTADNRIIQDMMDTPPSYYFVKANMELSQLVSKVKELVG